MLLRRQGTDILQVQETHLKRDALPILNKRHFPHPIQVHGSSKARGTTILFAKSIRYHEKASIKDKDGRYVITKEPLNNEMVTNASVYAPNDDQIPFLDDVFYKNLLFMEGTLFMAGDFNYVMDLQMDRTYQWNANHILTTNSYTVFRNLFKKYGFIDCWRHLNPTSKDYTYYSSKYNIYIRIDYCLTLKSEIHKIRASDIGLRLLMDHNWIICDLSLSDQAPTGYNWTSNRNLLHSSLLTQETVKTIQQYMELNGGVDCTESITWEALKATLRGTLISTAAFLKKLKEEKVQSLLSNIKTL